MSTAKIIAKLVQAGHEDLAEELLMAKTDIKDKVAEFFRKNPNPDDGFVHKFAEDNNLNPHQLEEVIYSLLTSLINLGKHNDVPDSEFDTEELAMGIKVEMEHTDDTYIAKLIAKDHLTECKHYYSNLQKMEKTCK